MSLDALGAQFHPHVQQYRSGGIGHLGEDRSVVGYVPTHVLEQYKEHDGIQNPHATGHDRRVIDSIRADIRSGTGIKEPLQVFHDPDQHWAYIGEGNHRLAAAREEGVPVVPVRVHSRARLDHKREKGVGAPLKMGTDFGRPGWPYTPPDVHPLHFEQFKDAR